MSSADSLSSEAHSLLHELRLRGVVERSDDITVVELTGLGYARRQDARVLLTVEGREFHARWARVPAGSDTEVLLQRSYVQFLELNRVLVRVCTDWQLRSGSIPNDHSDVAYDWAVIDRLIALDERAGPLVERSGETFERLASYRPRLRNAAGHVRDGAHEWLLSPRCDSYHTVWMQLHEDLLLALGLDRVAEESDSA